MPRKDARRIRFEKYDRCTRFAPLHLINASCTNSIRALATMSRARPVRTKDAGEVTGSG